MRSQLGVGVGGAGGDAAAGGAFGSAGLTMRGGGGGGGGGLGAPGGGGGWGDGSAMVPMEALGEPYQRLLRHGTVGGAVKAVAAVLGASFELPALGADSLHTPGAMLL